MAEKVQTGGVMEFYHDKYTGKLDNKRKRAIEQGYRESEERKKREKRRKIIVWIIIIIIVLFFLLLLLL
ncbi:MAG: hypothetical protein AABW65_00280 [Nanoarchaeota archaeon]